MKDRQPFAYYFTSSHRYGDFFRMANDPSVAHLLAYPDVYHATPLYEGESEEVLRERETEAANLEAQALSILERVTAAGSPLDLADECVDLTQAVDDLIAPYGTQAAILLFLRDEVNRAVHSEDGYYVDDLESTRERLEELRHPIPLE